MALPQTGNLVRPDQATGHGRAGQQARVVLRGGRRRPEESFRLWRGGRHRCARERLRGLISLTGTG
jgi:hypothetical protein